MLEVSFRACVHLRPSINCPRMTANCIRIASILQNAIRNKHAITYTCEIVQLFVLRNN